VTPIQSRRVARLLIVAIPSLVAATIAVAILQDVLGVPNPSAVYLVAVVAVGLASGTVGAILTSLASFLLYNFLFTEPRYTLSMHEPGAWLSAVLLLFAGIVVGQLVALQRSRTEIAAAREREARTLFKVSRALVTRESTAAVLTDITAILRSETRMARVWIALGRDDAGERQVASSDLDSGDAAHLAQTAAAVVSVLRREPGDEPAHWIRLHRATGRARGVAPWETYRVSIEDGGSVLGSIWATRERGSGPPDPTQTRLLSAAADQIGQALARDRLIADSQAAEVARQSDALKSALLQSVSHDLRTPLATIRAAAGTLRSPDGVEEHTRAESAAAIDREAEYLNRLVTNLLDLSRIEAGVLRAEQEVFELDDVLGRALERLRSDVPARQVEVRLNVPPVRTDPVFVDAAFRNLVENTIRHTPPGTAVRVSASELNDGYVRLTVEDAGPGVPADALPRIFEKFYRVDGRTRSRQGTGIGLAVVQGLIEAAGGRVGARASDMGGLAIDVDLPIAPAAQPAEQAEGPTLVPVRDRAT
jgi:two-component system, OmpR family, sensor histidine kinase KdpD